MSSNHLPLETLNALADDELMPIDAGAVRAHLNECHNCSKQALEAYQLRTAVRRAAVRNVPSAEVLARLGAVTKSVRKQPTLWPILRNLGWQAAAALLLVAAALSGWKWISQSNSLASEVLDEHLATLSEASQPEVVSSDRHTVKPWFEGKLPFSFNLPEANTLPSDTVLIGADLTFIHGRQVAVLRFMIHRHRTSVFVAQVDPLNGLPNPQTLSGFQFVEARSAGLTFLGVGDVNAGELGNLVRSIASAQ